MDWLRLNQRIGALSDSDVFIEFPELVDVVSHVPEPTEDVAAKMVALHRRNAADVLGVVKHMHGINFGALVSGGLPYNCFLNKIGKGEHLVEPIDEYVRMVTAVIERGLRVAFARNKPENEKEVQRQIAVALAAADEKFDRESPTFSYSVTTTTPDFSGKKTSVFIEGKLLTPKKRLGELVDEINADIPKYKGHAERARTRRVSPVLDLQQKSRGCPILTSRCSTLGWGF